MDDFISILIRKDIKPFIVAISSYFIVIAYWFILTSMRFLASADSGRVVIAIILGWFGCFIPCFINKRSIRWGIVGATISFLSGIFLGYVVFVQIGIWLVSIITTYQGILLSGSSNFALILLGIISAIQWVTDGILQNKRILRYLVGALAIVVGIVLVETLTKNLGPQPQLDFWRVIIYAPLIWGFLVYFTAKPTQITEGDKDETV